MNRLAAAAGLLVSGCYIAGITAHTAGPGGDTGYTRMLMFACLASIPLAFVMAMIGGRDRLPLLARKAREMARGGPASLLLLAGLVLLLVLLPAGMLAGIWAGLGLRSGLMFALFFVPVVLRLALAPARASLAAAVTMTVLLFASFFIGIGAVFAMERLGYGTGEYAEHLRLIWPGYGSAAEMFFSVCAFALLNQAVELVHGVRGVLGNGGPSPAAVHSR